MKFTAAQFCQNISFRFWQSNIPVSCSQQQTSDRRAEHKKTVLIFTIKGPSEINVITIDLYYLSIYEEIYLVVKTQQRNKSHIKNEINISNY
jgi:hypothetical protein